LNIKKGEKRGDEYFFNGRAVSNKDVLINPDSLDYYEKILPLLS